VGVYEDVFGHWSATRNAFEASQRVNNDS